MMAVKFLIGLLVVLFLVTFAAKNQQDVVVAYYGGYELAAKLWVAILGAFAAGVALAAVGAGFSVLRVKSRSWSLSRKVSKLEQELNDLKQKPLPDEPAVYPSVHNEAKALPQTSEIKSLPAQASASGK